MTFARTASRTVALLLAVAPVLPAAAQSPRPATTQPTRPAAAKPAKPAAVQPAKPAATQPAAPAPVAGPPAWTVTDDQARGVVGIMATARGGAAQFVGGCSKSAAAPGFTGAFSNYQGGGLRVDGQVEHVAFYARGDGWQDAFSVRLRYSSTSQSWEFDKPLAPVFLNSFSRGATLAVVNSRNQEVFAFDLTGSTAAVKAMRTVCGIPVG